VTGLYSAWLHVGSPGNVLPTTYGRTLAVKLALIAGLIGLGAFHRLWIEPRLVAAQGQEGGHPGSAAGRADSRLLRTFSQAIRLEVLLAIALLLAVGLLTQLVPAREAIVQARAPKASQTAQAGDLTVTLTLNSLQPGDNTFDVLVKNKAGQPVSDAERVSLRITMLDMDMGEAEAITAPRGDGHYAVSGPYLPMSGNWQTRVIVRRAGLDDVDAAFKLQMGSAANLATQPTAPTPPSLPALSSARGIGLMALAAGLLCGSIGWRLFRRGSGLGTVLLMLVPTALVVGVYLLVSPGGASSGPFTREPTNPIPGNAASAERGQALFSQNCVACHGPAGRGDGPGATVLNPRPPDFTQPHTAAHSDGYLFNIISNGSPGSAMPSWRGQLSEAERWDLVNYIRSLNPLTAAGGSRATPTPQASPPAQPTPPTPGAAGLATPAGMSAPTAAPASGSAAG